MLSDTDTSSFATESSDLEDSSNDLDQEIKDLLKECRIRRDASIDDQDHSRSTDSRSCTITSPVSDYSSSTDYNEVLNENMLDELKPIFEAEIQLDGETKKLFLQWNSKFVSSSHNFGAQAVVKTSNEEWILLPMGGDEYAEEQQIFWTLFMRDVLDDHDTLFRSISGDVSQIPLSLPLDVSWIGMCITLKRVVCADGIDASDPPMDPETTVPKDLLKALSHIQRARQERVERDVRDDAHIRAESPQEFEPTKWKTSDEVSNPLSSPVMTFSSEDLSIVKLVKGSAESQDDFDYTDNTPVVPLVSANWDSDRFKQSFNFAESSTNTLPQELPTDELRQEVEEAGTLRRQREAWDHYHRYQEAKTNRYLTLSQRKKTKVRSFQWYEHYPVEYERELPQIPRKQESSSVDDAVHSSEIIWNLENLDKFKPIFEAEIQLDGETKTLFLQWKSESIMYAVVKTLAGKWIRLPGHQAGMLKEYSKEIGIFNILHFQDKLQFDHWAQRAIGGIVHEFPIRFPRTVSWDKGSVKLQTVVHGNGVDAPN